MSLLPSTVVLGLAALYAWFLAGARTSPPGRVDERASAAKALVIATICQTAHFAEEALTGFPERVGEILGLPAMPFSFFVAFNLAWIGAWIAAVPGIGQSRRLAFFVAWFLAIAGIANGVLHPLLAGFDGRYFPGLITSPVVGAACIWLALRLVSATRAVASEG